MLLQVEQNRYHLTAGTHGTPILLLHGFTGSSENWAEIAGIFAHADTNPICLDLLGHGKSDAPDTPESYQMANQAGDIAGILDQLNLPNVSLLGYSMGGRLALYFACHYPNRVNQLILESASPGLPTPAEQQARIETDNRLADWIEQNGVPAFVHRWEQLPLWASQTKLPALTRNRLRSQRLKNQATGLANSLRGMGTGAQPSLWEDLGQLEMPAILLCGELDQKFVGIGNQMASKIPHCQLYIAPNAGHTIHLEQSNWFTQTILKLI